jgi:hypothetical protein
MRSAAAPAHNGHARSTQPLLFVTHLPCNTIALAVWVGWVGWVGGLSPVARGLKFSTIGISEESLSRCMPLTHPHHHNNNNNNNNNNNSYSYIHVPTLSISAAQSARQTPFVARRCLRNGHKLHARGRNAGGKSCASRRLSGSRFEPQTHRQQCEKSCASTSVWEPL